MKFVLIFVIFLVLASCKDRSMQLNDSTSTKNNQSIKPQKIDRGSEEINPLLQIQQQKPNLKAHKQADRAKPVTPMVNKLISGEENTPINKTSSQELNQAPIDKIHEVANDDKQNIQQESLNQINNEDHLFLDVFVNNEKRGEVIRMIQEKDQLWLSKEFVVSLQLQNLGTMKEENFFDENFIQIPQRYNPKIDMENFSLKLIIPPEDMAVKNLLSDNKSIEKTDSIFSFVWNYILGLYHNVSSSKASFNTHHRTVLTTPKGYFSNSLKLDKDSAKPLKAVRLETSYTVDWPKFELLFTLGDSASDAPNWSTHVASAGIKIQKSSIFNQGTLTYPTVDLIPALEKQGIAEIMLNNTNFFKKDLPMGRFLLDDIKLPPGAHQGELIVRDENGIVSKVPFSYFADKEMLKPGLQQFSYNFGFLRKNYLTESFSYGGPFLAANHKVGITNFMTLGLHGQLSNEVMLGSLEPRFGLGSFGSTAFPLAVSLRNDEKGQPKNGYSIGNETNMNIANLSLRLKNMYISPGYKPQDSYLQNSKTGIFISSASARYNKGFLRYTSVHYQLYKSSSSTNSVLSINQAIPIFQNVNIYANANYNFSQQSFSCFAVINIGFANRHSAGLIIDEKTDKQMTTIRTTANYRYHSDPQKDNRYFISTSVGYGQELFSEGVFGFNNKMLEGTVGLKGDSGKHFGYSGTLGGALVFAKNDFFLTKPIENSFSILRVPNRSGLKVYRDGGLFLGETQQDGYLIINDLNPYQKATISIDTRELDPSIDIQDLEKDVVIYPGIKTAHEIVLDAATIRHFVFRPRKNGKSLDFGSSIFINQLETFVGHDGSVYVELESTAEKILGNDKDTCKFNINLPALSKDEYVVDLGDISCE